VHTQDGCTYPGEVAAILANVYFTSGRYPEAEREYKAAVEKAPEFLRAWNNLGFFYYSQERYADAIPCLSRSIALGDSEPRTLGVLGFCLREEGNLIAAEMLYMQAVAVDPDNSDWTEGLLAIALDTEQYPRAEAYVRQLLKQKPDAAEKWMLLASLLVKQERRVEATAILETASSLGYANTEGLLLLGDLCAELRLNNEAIVAYTKAIPGAGEQGVERGVAFARLLIDSGELEKAENLLDSIQNPSSTNERVLLHHARADLHTARKEWPEARAELEELTQLDPLNGIALLQLGKLLHQADEPVRATFAYEAAAQVKDSAYHANLALGNLAIEANDYKAAVGWLEAALILTSTPEIREILAHVRDLAGEDD
jgi:tetratricopeptide (TPR) repeat protein